MLGQRDFAPVKSGLFEGGQRLLLDQRNAQAVARQGARQAQPGRASA